MKPLHLTFKDQEWPYKTLDHQRQIVRAIVVDNQGYYHFVHLERDDDFGIASLIETAGGGIERGETHESALYRELKEELGVSVEILTKLGIVEDAYNLIKRHNINHYYLCRIVKEGAPNLTEAEKNDFGLTQVKLSYSQAHQAYLDNKRYPLGRLVTQRELPILEAAKAYLDSCSLGEL
ncbi:TPA: NUDIX domain-containing protein [Streptococcus suis]